MSDQIPSASEPPPVAGLEPVESTDRIESLDVLRGFALMGILVVNIASFSMHDATLFNPTAYGNLEGFNYLVWFTTDLLFTQKFMPIFSMIFGAGIVLMTVRAEHKAIPSGRLHARRMFVLLGIGLLHSYLLWNGDILVPYAMCGFIVYLFRKRSPAFLITMGIGFLMVCSVLFVFFALSIPYWPPESIEEFAADFQPSLETIAEDLAVYRGGWVGQFLHRAPETLGFQTFVFLVWGLWRAGGMMLIGMGLFKLGVFSAERSKRFYAMLLTAGLVIGLPTVLFGIREQFRHDWAIEYSFFSGSQYNYWASVLLSLAWVGLVMLMCKKGVLEPLMSRLAAVGRMAFTNYLMQTIICTTIFYGYGFGLYGRIDRWGQILIVFAIWGLQLAVSPIWLRYFRFGPFEWLWRSLTYGRFQPMRRHP